MAGESGRSIEMLAAALEKEEFGRGFYAKAVEQSTNNLGKEIFRLLLAEEGIHIRRIKQIYEELKLGKAWSEKWKVQESTNDDLKALFRERVSALSEKVSPEAGDIEAIDIGMDFEDGAVKFYEDQLSKATDDQEKAFINEMIVEERGHYSALADMKFYYTNPESWYSEMERHGVDGA
jgi:rubrerythrin